MLISSPHYNRDNDISGVQKMSKIIFNEIQMKQLEKNKNVMKDELNYKTCQTFECLQLVIKDYNYNRY